MHTYRGLGVQLDNLRDKYGMKTVKIASLFAELNFPSKSGPWYDRLQKYTDPEKNPSPVRLRLLFNMYALNF